MGAGVCMGTKTHTLEENKEMLVTYQALGLTSKQIREFDRVFWKTDKHHKPVESVTLKEIMESGGFESRWLTKLMFRPMMLSKQKPTDDDIKFVPLMTAIWNMCTATPYLLSEMMFSYISTIGRSDITGRGPLRFSCFEVENLARAEFGSQSSDLKHLREILAILPYDKSGYITSPQFVTAAMEKDSLMLRPVIQFQQHLHHRVLTPAVWTLQSKRRIAFFGTRRIWEIASALFDPSELADCVMHGNPFDDDAVLNEELPPDMAISPPHHLNPHGHNHNQHHLHHPSASHLGHHHEHSSSHLVNTSPNHHLAAHKHLMLDSSSIASSPSKRNLESIPSRASLMSDTALGDEGGTLHSLVSHASARSRFSLDMSSQFGDAGNNMSPMPTKHTVSAERYAVARSDSNTSETGELSPYRGRKSSESHAAVFGATVDNQEHGDQSPTRRPPSLQKGNNGPSFSRTSTEQMTDSTTERMTDRKTERLTQRIADPAQAHQVGVQGQGQVVVPGRTDVLLSMEE